MNEYKAVGYRADYTKILELYTKDTTFENFKELSWTILPSASNLISK